MQADEISALRQRLITAENKNTELKATVALLNAKLDVLRWALNQSGGITKERSLQAFEGIEK
jgi:hypothetical protein